MTEIYGAGLERVVLFGWRARGDARRASDYDIAVFLHSLLDRMAELNRPADLRVALLDETGAFFDAFPYPVSAYLDALLLCTNARNSARRPRPAKPQSVAFMDKARQHLAKAQNLLNIHHWPDCAVYSGGTSGGRQHAAFAGCRSGILTERL